MISVDWVALAFIILNHTWRFQASWSYVASVSFFYPAICKFVLSIQSICWRSQRKLTSSDWTFQMKEFFSGDRILNKKPPYYRTAEVPDMWLSPELVWQIRGADFSISPVHQAAIGLVHPSRGISVRFPRFIHSVSDRKPEECSTADDIADMFNSQTRKMDINKEWQLMEWNLL